LEGLLQMNSADAVPILQDVLKQRDPCRAELRKKAVWLITQKRGVEIVPTLLDVARSDPSNDVRKEAIFWLSQARSEQAIAALDSVLFSAGDDEIRKTAIFSLSQYRDERARAAVRRAAEDTRMSDEIRGEAIFWLGNAKLVDLDYFKTLFGKTREPELRKKVIFAVQQLPGSEAATWLLDLAKNRAYDTETRKDAIFWLSQRRTIDLDALQSIYDGAKGDEEIQKQVIFVYTQRREPAAVDKLMDIAKNDPSIENRKNALLWLANKCDPRVWLFIRDMINCGTLGGWWRSAQSPPPRPRAKPRHRRLLAE
jgi:HEAT repeat protein